jgi:2,4-dienoyl-CoA reductase-like NADH-dependent reductase (Old Yellow Enzyme family)
MIFSPITIGSIKLKNRIIRSATWEGMCKDGIHSENLIKLYEELAENNVGLIITGYTYVSKEGMQLPFKMGLDDDKGLDIFKKLTDRVHEKGGHIAIQLVHGGGQANRKNSGMQPIAPSAISFPSYQEIPKEMTKDDIKRVVECFAKSAKRAKDVGFDFVQLHGAHGYLINQFLSPLTNKRKDEYGGSLENRFRFLKEVIVAIKDLVGDSYPLIIKLNGDDYLEGGFKINESAQVAKMLESLGILFIEVSGGSPASSDKNPARRDIDTIEKEGYHCELSKRVKENVNIPIGVVGGIRTFSFAEKIIKDKYADVISLSRPFIREPNLVKRWQDGDTKKSKCISCNGCFKPGFNGEGIYCVLEGKHKL